MMKQGVYIKHEHISWVQAEAEGDEEPEQGEASHEESWECVGDSTWSEWDEQEGEEEDEEVQGGWSEWEVGGVGWGMWKCKWRGEWVNERVWFPGAE